MFIILFSYYFWLINFIWITVFYPKRFFQTNLFQAFCSIKFYSLYLLVFCLAQPGDLNHDDLVQVNRSDLLHALSHLLPAKAHLNFRWLSCKILVSNETHSSKLERPWEILLSIDAKGCPTPDFLSRYRSSFEQNDH